MLWALLETAFGIALFSYHRDFNLGLLAGISLEFRFPESSASLAFRISGSTGRYILVGARHGPNLCATICFFWRSHPSNTPRYHPSQTLIHRLRPGGYRRRVLGY